MQPVAQVRREVVSRLAAPMPDSVFVAEFTKPRNWGFNTAAGNENPVHKNSIGACIYRTTTVTDGKEVPLRLTEPMRARGGVVPAGAEAGGSGGGGGGGAGEGAKAKAKESRRSTWIAPVIGNTTGVTLGGTW